MKTRFHRFSSSRSFAKLLSIMASRKSAVISVCAFAVLALEFSLAQALPYPTSSPPTSSTNFFGSGPHTVCEFDRRDVPEEVNVTISQVGDPLLDGKIKILLSGVAVCGIPTLEPPQQLQNYAFFDVNVTFGCVTKLVVGSTTVQYKESFGDCADADLVTGAFTAKVPNPETGEFAPVGNIQSLLQECTNPADVTSCLQLVGIQEGIPSGIFKNQVCPKNSSTGLTKDGQIFAFEEKVVNGQPRPGAIGACYCDGGLAGGAVNCGSGSTVEPQTLATSGALTCGFDYQKTGSGTNTINASGSPSTINAAIFELEGEPGTCPVAEIKTDSVKVCNGATPIKKSFKLQTNAGKTFLSFQFSEGACRETLNLPEIGEPTIIYVEGAFTDGTRFEGQENGVIVQ